MGRNLRSPRSNTLNHHQNITVSVFAMLIVAAIATVVAALCVSRHRKPSSPKPSSPHPQPSSPSTSHKSSRRIITSTEGVDQQEPACKDDKVVVLDVSHGPIEPSVIPPIGPSTSRRRLSINLSSKLPEGLARIRTKRQQEKSPAEDSLLNKTIILGERCRVPSEDEEATVVDEKGNQQRIYRPRTPRSLPVSPRSRNGSFAGAEVLGRSRNGSFANAETSNA